jgi:hypothetical protein
MIQLMLILLLIHYIGIIIFKPKTNVLSCGIFAWAGQSVKGFSKAKFDILGLYNNSRGGDSCGVTTDGEIYYGVQTNKNYSSFITEQSYLNPAVVPVVFGHTRKSSMGFNFTDINAHPFGFGELNEGYKFIGCHNGTLVNHLDLAKKYNVEVDLWDETLNRKSLIRTKIDSEILLECIYNDSSIKVLNEYIGGAALIFQNLEKPNVIYAYHGASRKELTDEDTTKYEERPLYYYKEGRNSLYISSMAEPLVAIGGILEKNIHEFDHNILYEIENGNIEKAVKFKVNRDEAAHKKGVISYHGQNFQKDLRQKSHTPSNTSQNMIGTRTMMSHTTNFSKRGKKSKKYKTLDNNIVRNIYEETDDLLYKSGITFKKLRYWRNGHLIEGIYTYVTGYGFYKLDEDYDKAVDKSYDLLNNPFDISVGNFLNDKEPDYKSGNIIVPFAFKGKNPPLLYFQQGIMLENSLDYAAILGKYKTFSLENLSMMSRHPLIDITLKRRNENDQRIIKDGKLYTGTHSWMQSGKIYNIVGGDLKSIEIIDSIQDALSQESDSTPNVIQLPISFEEHNKEELNKLENSFKIGDEILTEKFIELMDEISEDLNEFENEDPELDLLKDEQDDDLINEVMVNVYLTIQEASDRLKTESNLTENINEIIDLNEDYLESLNNLFLIK